MALTKKRSILLIFLLFLFAVSVNSFLIEPDTIEEKTIEITDTGLSMNIVFLSDFQRNNEDPSFVQRAVDAVNSQNPDLILLGGDYVENRIGELASISPLKDLRSKFGVYGVMGNHDYGAFGYARQPGGDGILADKIIKFLETPNKTDDSNYQGNTIKIIRNEKVIVDDRLTIIGLDDLWAHLRDEERAYSEKEDTGYRILLSHNQEDLEITKEHADLFLFGHTHCGQIRLPGLGSVPKLFGFSGEYDMGYYLLEDGAHVYTTCGLAPFPRLLNPPEIAIIKLSH